MRTNILLIIFTLFLILSCGNNPIKKPKEYDSKGIETKKPVSFDPDGYYLPVDTIKYRNFLIQSLLISTSDSITANGDKVIRSATIQIVNESKGNNWEIETKVFELKNKDFQATFTNDTIGIIKITSIFLGQNGPINDKVRENETIVMKGKIEINSDYHKNTDFKYFAGD